jgi:hypothetical protein
MKRKTSRNLKENKKEDLKENKGGGGSWCVLMHFFLDQHHLRSDTGVDIRGSSHV